MANLNQFCYQVGLHIPGICLGIKGAYKRQRGRRNIHQTLNDSISSENIMQVGNVKVCEFIRNVSHSTAS